ncbi:MAG TPA: DUF4388 domain-containing protein [Pyrinomonadaceae bacterium]|jgi:hypothetical protein|nr:DUF4388 domain-containing protein [Pyrinomonadaceae bacterium]
MALTGHLSDLSLSELIEFFCNQRKSGRLRVLYPQGSGYFYLQGGSVIHAQIGVLHGIDAVYYALTLANAKFEFSGSADAPERTINQPWTQVVLEGLRRLDEGIAPTEAFPEGYAPDAEDAKPVNKTSANDQAHHSHVPGFLSFMNTDSPKRKPLFAGAVAVALLGSVAAIGVPAGWYSGKAAAVVAEAPAVPVPVSQPEVSPSPESVAVESPATSAAPEDAAALAARKQRERDRAKAREEKAALSAATISPAAAANSSGPKRVSVTVTYDESGRVVQASGGDASALRIARQKRFPPGKAGSATVTIPIN